MLPPQWGGPRFFLTTLLNIMLFASVACSFYLALSPQSSSPSDIPYIYLFVASYLQYVC